MASRKQSMAFTGMLVAISATLLAQTVGLNPTASAESILVPRLGFHSALTKRVYLDFTPPEPKKKPAKTETKETPETETPKATDEATPLNPATTQPASTDTSADMKVQEPEPAIDDEPIPEPELLPQPDVKGLTKDERNQRIKEWKEENETREKEYKTAVQLKKMKAKKREERLRDKEKAAKKALNAKQASLNETTKDSKKDKHGKDADKKAKKDDKEPVKPNWVSKILVGDWEAKQRITAKEAANGTFLLIDIRRNRILFNEKAEMNPLTEDDVKADRQKQKKAESDKHSKKKVSKSKKDESQQAIELDAPEIDVIKSYKNKASVLLKALNQSSEQLKAQTDYENALSAQQAQGIQVSEGIIEPGGASLPVTLIQPETDTQSLEVKPATAPVIVEDVSPQAIHDNVHRPYFVEFKENGVEGVFDVAVRGSGFRSKDPIWISKDVYWDALMPVLSDMTKAHCPERPNAVSIERQCMVLEAKTPSVFPGQMHPGYQLVKGGWYTPAPEEMPNRVKDTVAISRIATYLVNMYNLNPASYNYLNLKGDHFVTSAQPDLLDEANWGLQFLLTSQYPDGGFGNGVIRQDVGNTSLMGDYALEQPSAEPTARAIIALAAAAKAYEKNDLSFSVKMVRAADKGWRYLIKAPDAKPEWVFLASLALFRVSPDPKYQGKTDQTVGQIAQLTPEQQLLIGKPSDEIPPAILDAEVTIPSSTDPNVLLPALALLQVGNTHALNNIAQWMSDLYGYDSVSLMQDPKFEVKSAWSDPLQWMAYKTGEVLTKYSYYSQDRSGIQDSQATDTKALELIDAKTAASKGRMKEGYKQLKMTVEDRAVLAYSLALLNQGASLAELAQIEAIEAKKKHHKGDKEPEKTRFDELLEKDVVVPIDKQHRIAPPKP